MLCLLADKENYKGRKGLQLNISHFLRHPSLSKNRISCYWRTVYKVISLVVNCNTNTHNHCLTASIRPSSRPLKPTPSKRPYLYAGPVQGGSEPPSPPRSLHPLTGSWVTAQLPPDPGPGAPRVLGHSPAPTRPRTQSPGGSLPPSRSAASSHYSQRF